MTLRPVVLAAVFGLSLSSGSMPGQRLAAAEPPPVSVTVTPIGDDPAGDPTPGGKPADREAVPGNEIVLRVDRYTFTQSDIDTTANSYHPVEAEELYNSRRLLETGNPQVTARTVKDLQRKLEKKAISTLVSNAVMTEAVDAEVYIEYKKMLAEEYDRWVLSQVPTFEQYMARRHWTKADVDNERQRYVVTRLRYLVIQQVLPQVQSVSTEEMTKYYNAHKSQFTIEKGYRIRMLWIDKAMPHDEPNLHKLTRQIRQEFLDGAPFDDLARKYSDNRETKALGGLWICTPQQARMLGVTDPSENEWVTPSAGEQSNALFFSTAASLDPTQRDKQISNVVELQGRDSGSFVLLYLEKTRPERLLEYKDVPREYLIKLTQRRKADLLAQQWTADKLADSRIEYRGEVVPFSEFWSKDLDE